MTTMDELLALPRMTAAMSPMCSTFRTASSWPRSTNAAAILPVSR